MFEYSPYILSIFLKAAPFIFLIQFIDSCSQNGVGPTVDHCLTSLREVFGVSFEPLAQQAQQHIGPAAILRNIAERPGMTMVLMLIAASLVLLLKRIPITHFTLRNITGIALICTAVLILFA